MKAEEYFYKWAATYGDNQNDADICKYGKELMIEFAQAYASHKQVTDEVEHKLMQSFGFTAEGNIDVDGQGKVFKFMEWMRESLSNPKEREEG